MRPLELSACRLVRFAVTGALDAVRSLHAAGVVIGMGRTAAHLNVRLKRRFWGNEARRRFLPAPLLSSARYRACLQECQSAVRAGATLVSHLLSRMQPFHHRDPGPMGLLVDGGHDEGEDANGG